MKILTFHNPDKQSPGRFGAAYYLADDYTPVAVRIQAEEAPHSGSATFDIFDDGETIFENRATWDYKSPTTKGAVKVLRDTDTSITLGEDSPDEEAAENLKEGVIEAGSWVTCNLVSHGGGKNFTVQLELNEVE